MLVFSGVLNGLLLFVFCNVFSVIVFHDAREGNTLKEFLHVGLEMNLFAVLVGSAMFAAFSGCAASMAGPDINPALFLAGIVETIQLGSDPDNLPPLETIVPTSIFAIAFASVVIGLVLLAVGRFKLTGIVQYLPAALLHGFLACIGYKVMKAALTTTCGDVYYKKPGTFMFWKLLLPALPLGVGLYVVKAYRIGRPAVMMPVLLTVPLVVFYLALAASGISIDEARAECTDLERSGSCSGGWFYPEFNRGAFTDVFGQFQLANIHWESWVLSCAQLPALIMLVVVDYLLQTTGSKKALQLEFPLDHEVKTAGVACLVSGVLGLSFPAYAQTKFTSLNYSATHNLTSRIPTVVCGLFNGVLFFWGFPLINFLPRFFLGGLLIYGGLGFVVDNLFKSRTRVSVEEFIAIWIIVVVNATMGLLEAVLVGIVLSAIIFAVTYSRLAVVKSYLCGSDYESRVVRSPAESTKLTHLATRYGIVQMQNYIFFGSAGQVFKLVKRIVAERDETRFAQRISYLIFDWTNVYGIDFSGVGVFNDVLNLLKKEGILVVFSGVSMGIMHQLMQEDLLKLITGVYDTLDFAAEWVEEQLLDWAFLVRSRWLEFRPAVKLHETAKSKAKHDALEEVLKGLGFGPELWKYIKRVNLRKKDVLGRPGEPIETMYIVQQGKISAYVTEENGYSRKVCSYTRGAYINECALFTTQPQEGDMIADTPNTIVLALTQDALAKLQNDRPDIVLSLQRNVLSFYHQTNSKLEREIGDLEHTRFSRAGSTVFDRGSTKSINDDQRRGPAIGSFKWFTSSQRGANDQSSVKVGPHNRRGSTQGLFASMHRRPKQADVEADFCIGLAKAVARMASRTGSRTLLHLMATASGDGSRDSIPRFLFADDIDIRYPSDPGYVPVHVYTDGTSANNRPTAGDVLRVSSTHEREVRACFRRHDVSHKGTVLASELQNILEDAGHYTSRQEIALLIEAKDELKLESRAQSGDHSRTVRTTLNRILKEASATPNGPRHVDTSDISRDDQTNIIEIDLSAVAFFPRLMEYDPESLHSVAARSQLLVFRRGELIAEEGDKCDSMLIVLEGIVTVTSTAQTQPRLVHASQHAIPFFDHLVFTEGSIEPARDETLEAVSPVVLIVEVPRRWLRNTLRAGHPLRAELQEVATRAMLSKKTAHTRRQLGTVFAVQQRAPFGVRYNALAKTSIFSGIAASDRFLLSRVAGESEVDEFASGTFLWHEGDEGNYMLVIIYGDVRVSSGTKGRLSLAAGAAKTTGTRDIHFHRSKGGYELGTASLIDSRVRRSEDVLAISDIVLALRISRQSLEGIFDPTHGIWEELESRKEGPTGAVKPSNKAGARLLSTIGRSLTRTRVDPSKKDGDGISLALATSPHVAAANGNAAKARAEPRASGVGSTALLVTESDVLNMVCQLTFYPLTDEHGKAVRAVFDAYKTASSGAEGENAHPDFVAEAGLTRLLRDADINLSRTAMRSLLREWGCDIGADISSVLQYSAFVSMVAAGVKRQQMQSQVEETFYRLTAASKPTPTLDGEDVMRRFSLAGAAVEEEGLSVECIREAWSRFLDTDISAEACEEMIFECDLDGDRLVSLENWLDTINMVHRPELENTDSFDPTAADDDGEAEADESGNRLPGLLRGGRRGSAMSRTSSIDSSFSSGQASTKLGAGARLLFGVSSTGSGADAHSRRTSLESRSSSLRRLMSDGRAASLRKIVPG